MKSSLASWRLAFKLALRDLRRYKGRSFLAALLIFVPVLAMAVLLTGMATGEVSGSKQAEEHLRGAAASVQFNGPMVSGKPAMFPAAGRVVGPDHGQPTAAQVSQQAHATTISESIAILGVTTAPGGPRFTPTNDMQFLQTDLSSTLGRRTATLDSGHWPTKAGEVVVTRKGRIAGLPKSGRVKIFATNPTNSATQTPAGELSIVGTVTSTEGVELMGPTVPRLSSHSTTPEFIVAGSHPWAASTIQQWERYGAFVTTRDAPTSPDGDALSSSDSGVVMAIGTMGFIAVTALLAGPAFAASATRQRRTLGLIAANGATRAVLRRVVLAQAFVLGVLTAAVSIVLGAGIGVVGAKWGHLHFAGTPAPTDIPVRWLIGLLVVSTIASLVAASVPARSAGRTNLLAALRGQVSSRVVRKRWPLIGLLGIALGTGCLLLATADHDSGKESRNVLLAYLGVPLFFGGAVLAVPFFLMATGRLAAHLPVTARIAVRDVSRQRTRATASVGAVLATVAVLCAASIFGASVDAYTRKQHIPMTAVGSGSFQTMNASPLSGIAEHQALAGLGTIRALVPRSTPLWTAVADYNMPRLTADSCTPKATAETPFSGVAVIAIDPADIAKAGFSASTKAMLTHGGGIVMTRDGFTPGLSADKLTDDQIRNGSLTVRDQNPTTVSSGFEQRGCHATSLKVSTLSKAPKNLGSLPGGSLVVSKDTLSKMGVPASLWAISVDPDEPLTATREHQLAAVTPPGMQLGVEHGYQSKLFGILAAITAGFALIVLLTTIVSTLLNDAESQPDMATLAATGAPRGMRRRIVGAHAAAIGFIGAVGGIAVGFIPGLVLARAATTQDLDSGHDIRGTYAVSWWPLAVMLVIVPLVAASISMLFARRTPSLTRREA